MSNNKQSSVEWLVNQIDCMLPTYLIEQAKAMHKEEIMNAWIAVDNEIQRIAAEQYYNEKYANET